MAKKKTIKHAGVTAEIEEEDVSEIRMVDKRQKEQKQPPEEKYWTSDSYEAEMLANKGVKLITVLSAFNNLPKRWVFDITKEAVKEIK